MNIIQTIAKELNIKINQVEATITLLDDGDTVPFIARYRKEVTGALDDAQLRILSERLQYLRELEERRETILKSIEEQGKLTEELKQQILEADNKARLEDLYLPYKPKRRTKAQIAREAGLEPLALSLWQNPNLIPEDEAKKYLNPEKKIETVLDALDGAKQILMENFSEQADLLENLRKYLWENAVVTSSVISGKEDEGNKFADYFTFQEPIKKIPSHRALALFRGRNEGILQLALILPDKLQEDYCKELIAKTNKIENKKRAADLWLSQVIDWTWKIKLQIKLELDLMGELCEKAEVEAIRVFANNLKNLLMAAPAGNRVTMGLDPGLRTGVKVVVIDNVGKLLAHIAIFPHAPRNDWDQSIAVLAALCAKYRVELISIGNGTASRETDRLAADLIKKYPALKLTKIVVSEAGASVYSASELASEEFPDLDVSYRGAVSIARRLQDPLAELVKIDPKAIGVGQYQHDVNQVYLSKSLDAVMEDCVNAVGADVNMASVQLLSSISGLNSLIAKNIVAYREKNGRFRTRDDIKKVSRLGDKSFEQAVGFLRIIGGDNPLDASAVHPESYEIVEKILNKLHKSIKEVMGNEALLKTLAPKDFTDERFGMPTVQDIITELNKPGRDPRPEFKTATFSEGIESIEDLKPGMLLEGVITNVTNFGAFVDIGVHQDGLVHISEMANQYISDANKIVKVGQIVNVKVLEVDVKRKRIALSMRLDGAKKAENKKSAAATKISKVKSEAKLESAFASAFVAALKK